jgi:hypothetical protein
MTPNDIVGMALLNGLDLIAITDHNTVLNTHAVIKAAEGKGIIVLPGMEVSTAEEVHVLCLFDSIGKAVKFEEGLRLFLPTVENRKDIFGNQLVYDENDRLIGEVSHLLSAPTGVSFDALHSLTNKHGGAFIPAHIDRDSFSVLSNLGFLPPDLCIRTLEVSKLGAYKGFIEKNSGMFSNNRIITSSDAHRLWEISENTNYITLPNLSAKAAIDFLR